MKFLGYMRIQKLHETILAKPDEQIEAGKNAEAFAELVQCLDDRSLSLVIRDAKDDGRKALQILRDHYLSKSKPKIIGLYTELTSLVKAPDENVTDYMLRAETAATSLKSSGEVISDSLLVAMLLKGLPAEFDSFSTVITQKDKELKFSEFKVSLRSFEETQKTSKSEDSIMKLAGVKSEANDTASGASGGFKCFRCHRYGHKANECKSKNLGTRRWCDHCRSSTHDTSYCRGRRDMKDSAKAVGDSHEYGDGGGHSFAFKVDHVQGTRPGKSLLVDCGATTHIMNDPSKFITFDESFDSSKHFIEVADGRRANNIATKRGTAKTYVVDNSGKCVEIILKNALCIPSYPQDIFSVHAATENGATVTFEPDCATLKIDKTVFSITKHGKLYFLKCVNNRPDDDVNVDVVNSVNCTRDLKEWHRVMGHCNVNDVAKLESVVDGMHICSKDKFICETCSEGKMIKEINRNPDKRATSPLELVHCDLAGPVDPAAKDGYRYALNFVDDYSGVMFVYFLQTKDQTVRATEKFLADAAPFGQVKRIRSDNGGEFTCQDFQTLLIKNKISHEKSAPYSPHQNGTVERSWRSIFEMARCMLIESKLPKFLWAYAVMMSVYIRNRCYNNRLKITPFEAFTGNRPNLSKMHVFGTTCFAYVENAKKLDPRSEKGVFVGFDRGSAAYLVYIPTNRVVRRVRCVKFTDSFDDVQDDLAGDGEIMVHKAEAPVENVQNENVQGNDVNLDDEVHVGDEVQPRYPKRDRGKPKYLNDYETDYDQVKCTVDYCYNLVTDVPNSYEEAIGSSDAKHWKKAMDEEMSALKENQTFKITPLPEGRKAVGGRWVYARKLGPNNEEQYKARFVAKGYSQLPGIDYGETFSPTARMTSLRALVELSVEYGLVLHQMDVKTAFLNAPIDTELYVEQPQGYEVKDQNGEEMVCRLNKSLYGLKQSGRNWNEMLHSHFIAQGFKQSLADSCVYSMCSDKEMTIVIIWVDDIIIATDSDIAMNKVKRALNEKFKMKDMGEISYFLGIKFTCENDAITLDQSRYITRILSRFGLENCKPKGTPYDVGLDNEIDSNDTELVDCRLYREIVGSLIYVMTCTRPDLCYVVTRLSQFMSRPTERCLIMAKHVLRYLKGTLDKKLIFRKSIDDLKLIGFCDSDWGGSEDRKSISGHCFKLSDTGPLVSWKSRKQPTVALSTCEAEYVSLASATQEAKFLMQLLNSMTSCDDFRNVTLHCDNQGAIALTKNPVQHQRSKHIDIKYHFVRDEVKKDVLSLRYVASEENIADLFTKTISRAKFEKFSALMMGS